MRKKSGFSQIGGQDQSNMAEKTTTFFTTSLTAKIELKLTPCARCYVFRLDALRGSSLHFMALNKPKV